MSFIMFLQGDPGDPLTTSFSRIWRNDERDARAREADGRGETTSGRSPRWRVRTLSSLQCGNLGEQQSHFENLRTSFASHLPTWSRPNTTTAILLLNLKQTNSHSYRNMQNKGLVEDSEVLSSASSATKKKLMADSKPTYSIRNVVFL